MTTRVPAVEGWFTMDEAAPALLGTRGTESGSYFWPPNLAVSANPDAPFEAREPVELSRTGTLWSWSTNHYQPPEPYIPNGPDGTFAPYTVCAVELAHEQMVVLGPLATAVDPSTLEIGMAMELVLGPLFTEDGVEHTIYQFSPRSASGAAALRAGGLTSRPEGDARTLTTRALAASAARESMAQREDAR